MAVIATEQFVRFNKPAIFSPGLDGRSPFQVCGCKKRSPLELQGTKNKGIAEGDIKVS